MAVMDKIKEWLGMKEDTDEKLINFAKANALKGEIMTITEDLGQIQADVMELDRRKKEVTKLINAAAKKMESKKGAADPNLRRSMNRAVAVEEALDIKIISKNKQIAAKQAMIAERQKALDSLLKKK